MASNRSVPVDTVLPHIYYRDIPSAIAWLTQAFGFTEHYRYGDPVSGAQIYLGGVYIMLQSAGGHKTPAELGWGTQYLTLFLDDLDGHFARARDARVKLVEELHETVYGERQYAAEDLEGHHWLFSQHAKNVSPEDWGATAATPATHSEY